MDVRFLLGPAGSGKTFRCQTEIREALSAAPEGPPLVLLAPKQATYQLEWQLLAGSSLPGYTRLRIFSFERLASFILEQLHQAPPRMLDEEGRLMVLRGLLTKRRNDLKLFRASARLTGFAQQLSLVLAELQRNQLTPEALNQLAEQVPDAEGLAEKLQDLATLLQDYLLWLKAHQLQDADGLLAAATDALTSQTQCPKSKVQSPKSADNATSKKEPGSRTEHAARNTRHEAEPLPFALGPPPSALRIGSLWLDGFAELSPQELSLLAPLIPHCARATLAFCLDEPPPIKVSWLSNWSVVGNTFAACRQRLGGVAHRGMAIEVLARDPQKSRFLKNPVLRHLEQCWTEPRPFAGGESSDLIVSDSLRLAICDNPESEAVLAAREILRQVRAGGRYRDITVMARKLDPYREPIQRVFFRYQIPFFLDRRESVSHHPLAELTRSGLRTVAFGWLPEDWFAALKTGLVPAEEDEVDRLENEALARGWTGSIWQKPIVISGDEGLSRWLADLHRRLLPPFQRLALVLATHHHKPTGSQLAAGLREFWNALRIEERLDDWATADLAPSEFRIPSSVHATVWEQMNAWLDNLALGFSHEALPLREWLPILEAGLSNLTVGVIPPALDQVLIGAIDRSRNPDIKLAIVLGLNETVFPAPPAATVLLSELDRLELEKRNVRVGNTARDQLGRERYYAYIACTRARQRLVLTCAQQDGNGAPLNPSPFLSRVRRLFPTANLELAPHDLDWRENEHISELIGKVLRVQSPEPAAHGMGAEVPLVGCQVSGTEHGTRNTVVSSAHAGESAAPALGARVEALKNLLSLPGVNTLLERVRHFQNPQLEESLSPALAAKLYGPILRTSVSRMEQFAACPFKFFVHSGLRAQERQLFELDVKEQGSFQHDVLAFFHEQLRSEGKRWREITPQEARERIGRIAQGLLTGYRDGLLQATEQSRFTARVLTESLQDFVEIIVGWMRRQYQFDPVAVELPFGGDPTAPPWVVPLSQGHSLALYGRIDRVDLFPEPAQDQALCVVVDYKSSPKELDPVLMAHGLQLQLPAYLNVLRHWPDPTARFGVKRLIPAGVFYVNLRGRYEREQNRLDALAGAPQARLEAYRHAGRFDLRALRQLDSRTDARQGDQFNYRLTKDGAVFKNSRQALSTSEFELMLDTVETNLRRMGEEIFSGNAQVAPYRKGTLKACDQCGYQSICRIDPWTHRFRVWKANQEA